MKLDELEGGKAVLLRMLDAYGFSMQKELGDMHDLSSGTISTWIRRDYFPGDVVVACALDTGVSLRWLATGKGYKYESGTSSLKVLPKFSLSAGKLLEDGSWSVDKEFIAENVSAPVFIAGNTHSWIVNKDVLNISNGRWLLSIDGNHDVYDVIRLPGNKIKVSQGQPDNGFTCNTSDVDCIGQVVFTVEKNS